MGSRSEVGFCFKPDIEVPDFEKQFPGDIFRCVRDARGTLFLTNHTKWNNYLEKTLPYAVDEFLLDMDDQGLTDYYWFVKICGNEDGSEELDRTGGWFPNAFELDYRGSILVTADDSEQERHALQEPVRRLLDEARAMIRDADFGWAAREMLRRPEDIIQEITALLGDKYNFETGEGEPSSCYE